MIEAMKRKAYRLLDYVARIINTWDIEGDFVSYLNDKINKDHNDLNTKKYGESEDKMSDFFE